MARLRDLELSARRVLPASLLSVRFSRSSGPGGQHVNKVASKADLRLDLAAVEEILGAAAVARIRTVLRSRLDGDGNLQVVSEEHRRQSANVEEAISRMETLLRGALTVAKKRRPTRPTAGSRERRLRQKRQRSDIKKGRARPE